MSGAGWVRVLVTIPVALRDAANLAAAGLDFDSGGGLTFDVPLAPAGQTEPTDFGACSLMRPWTADEVATELLPGFPGARVYSGAGGWTPEAGLADAGLVVLAGGGP